VRQAFLLSETRSTGWWYYFPLALVFKLPLTTIAALLIAAITAARRRPFERTDAISFLAVGVIAAGYFAVAMGSNLNIGVRHVMPLLPIAYVAAVVLITRALSPRHGVVATALIAAALLLELLPQWPDFLPFFNAASGGSRGGVRLLSDSNLDWGQDLPLLKRWQDAHPDVKLYLCYFGAVPPEAYGIRYTNLPGGHWTAPPQPPTTPGVLAVSATKLQGMYLPKGMENAYRPLLHRQPRDIVGTTIYLYDYP
jgi:energy-converting hydrogenase Eha subunit C